jgi:mono/diheme cytochrome c family protein
MAGANSMRDLVAFFAIRGQFPAGCLSSARESQWDGQTTLQGGIMVRRQSPGRCGLSGGTAFVIGSVAVLSCAGYAARKSAPLQPLALAVAAAAEPASQPAARPSIDRGEALYAQHCQACHGAKGDGKGLAAAFLFPKPRDFRAGRFRLISTANGIPTAADLEQVLVRGMPGSAMISWAHLSEADRKLLVNHIIKLRRDGARDVELLLAKEADETLSEEDLKAAVDRLTTPGEVREPPVSSQSSPEAIARGLQLYKTKGCASCHGEKGKGDGQQKMVDAEGLPTRPRDLTRGIFKGSPDYASVYRRIWLGMPGSPMPASQNLTPEEMGDLTHFVLSLSDERARNATVLKRMEFLAERVKQLPASSTDEAWNSIRATPLTMTPLWWRDDADPDLRVQAAHDGKHLALQLSWNDAEPDRHALRSEAFKDAVAIELYRGPNEPFVGMGARDAPADVWMWDADRASGGGDVESANPRMVVDAYPITEALVSGAEYGRPTTKSAAQAKVTLPAVAAGNQIAPTDGAPTAASLESIGPGSLTFRLPRNQLVQSQGQWRNGRWEVTLTRVLQMPPGDAGVPLEPGSRVSIAFAVWNGSQRDRDGQKLITIWQDLVLEK